jgi:hypothetical protein
MSRINELRKQHPNYALDAIEILRLSIPEQSTKYLELLIKLTKDDKTEHDDDYRGYKLNSLKNEYDVDENIVEHLSTSVLAIMEDSLERLISPPNHKTFRKFCELNERGLIENNDVTAYSTMDQIEHAVSMAELKSLDKGLVKQIKIIFEDDEWIILRPLSLEASQKYGAATKWCTTSAPNPDGLVEESDNYGKLSSYFDKYSYRGILIYTINKKTGHKIGTFKNLDPDREREFSFWNAKDDRIDSLDSGLPIEILGKVKDEIYNFSITNYAVAGKDDYTKRVKVVRNKTALSFNAEEPIPTPQGETMDALRRMIWAASEGIENEQTDF